MCGDEMGFKTSYLKDPTVMACGDIFSVQQIDALTVRPAKGE